MLYVQVQGDKRLLLKYVKVSGKLGVIKIGAKEWNK